MQANYTSKQASKQVNILQTSKQANKYTKKKLDKGG